MVRDRADRGRSAFPDRIKRPHRRLLPLLVLLAPDIGIAETELALLPRADPHTVLSPVSNTCGLPRGLHLVVSPPPEAIRTTLALSLVVHHVLARSARRIYGPYLLTSRIVNTHRFEDTHDIITHEELGLVDTKLHGRIRSVAPRSIKRHKGNLAGPGTCRKPLSGLPTVPLPIRVFNLQMHDTVPGTIGLHVRVEEGVPIFRRRNGPERIPRSVLYGKNASI